MYIIVLRCTRKFHIPVVYAPTRMTKAVIGSKSHRERPISRHLLVAWPCVCVAVDASTMIFLIVLKLIHSVRLRCGIRYKVRDGARQQQEGHAGTLWGGKPPLEWKSLFRTSLFRMHQSYTGSRDRGFLPPPRTHCSFVYGSSACEHGGR